MGGFFGAVSANDCVLDVFYGTDYHSHLGTRRGGMTSYSAELGFQRNIHSIENSPFRTKFEKDVEKMRGNICIGCISDTDPQPIMVRSKLGLYAVCSIGIIQNAKALSEELLESGCANFETMSSGNINSGGLIGALIAQKYHVFGHHDRGFHYLCKRSGRKAANSDRKAFRRLLLLVRILCIPETGV